ncbi:hypothetical protein SPD79_05265 [Oceanobacillus sp. SE10311]
MDVINKISNIAGKYFALIIIIFSVIAFLVPEWFSSFGSTEGKFFFVRM